MAKNLLINKFYVRFNGKRYGKGDTIPNVPDEIAKQLIADSHGGIIEIAVVASPASDADSENKNPPNENEHENKNFLENETPKPSADLPVIDPKTTVANTKKKQP